MNIQKPWYIYLMVKTLLDHYQALLKEIDRKCDEAQKNVPEIPCKKGCFDCCKQLFPLSMIEAYYLNHGFKKLPRKLRRELQLKAKKYQEKLKKLNFAQYELSADSLEKIAFTRRALTLALNSARMDCPILSETGLCQLYDYRNHDCRIHGMAYDQNTKELIGCFRHPHIFNNNFMKKKFRSGAVSSDYLYKEKSKLDSLLTVELSQNPELKYCYYFTTPYLPLLKDFETFDWARFFLDKSKTLPPKKYLLIIDQ